MMSACVITLDSEAGLDPEIAICKIDVLPIKLYPLSFLLRSSEAEKRSRRLATDVNIRQARNDGSAEH